MLDSLQALMTETERIQNATAVIEVVSKRLTFRGPTGDLVEADVVDSLVLLSKECQKTFYETKSTMHNHLKYKWVQLIDGRPVQAFDEKQILVIL